MHTKIRFLLFHAVNDSINLICQTVHLLFFIYHNIFRRGLIILALHNQKPFTEYFCKGFLIKNKQRMFYLYIIIFLTFSPIEII